jgi:hypothetical protein
MTKEGWKLLEDTPFSGGDFSPKDIEFIKFDESFTSIKKLQKKAKRLGACLGQHHAEWLIKNPQLIPEKLKCYYLIFPGTIWQISDSIFKKPYFFWHDCLRFLGIYYENCKIPYLRWDGWQWCLGFCLAEDVRSSEDRLVRLNDLH